MSKNFFRTLFLLLCIFSAVQTSGFSQPTVIPDYKDMNYANDDMEAHCLDVYLPKDRGVKPKVVIVIYGSAWFSNNAKVMAYMSVGKPLTDAGFAVVCINHRSSSDAVFPAQIQDVKGAIRFVRANADKLNIDTSFIGITGFSSGGHLSSLAGVTNDLTYKTVGETTIDLKGDIGGNQEFSSNVDAVVDWFGPADMSRMENCSTVKGANSPEAALIGGNPAEMPDMVNLVSPIFYVNESCPPFLVIHGEADNVVSHCQSEYFSEVLSRNGVLENFISVPQGQHGPVTFNEETFKAMTDFFLKVSDKGCTKYTVNDSDCCSGTDKDTTATLPQGFVFLKDYVPDLIEDIRYSTSNNFMGKQVDGYESNCVIISEPAAKALKEVADEFRGMGYVIKVFDAYRPQRAVNHFVRWAKDPDDQRNKKDYYPTIEKVKLFPRYIASKSGHSKGSTLDMTICDKTSKAEVDMGSHFDYFGPPSHTMFVGTYSGGKVTKKHQENRLLLKRVMEKYHFKNYENEWWHFTLVNEPYPKTYFDFPVKM